MILLIFAFTLLFCLIWLLYPVIMSLLRFVIVFTLSLVTLNYISYYVVSYLMRNDTTPRIAGVSSCELATRTIDGYDYAGNYHTVFDIPYVCNQTQPYVVVQVAMFYLSAGFLLLYGGFRKTGAFFVSFGVMVCSGYDSAVKNVNAQELNVEVEGCSVTILSDPGGFYSFLNFQNLFEYGVPFVISCYLSYRMVSTCHRPVGRVVFSYYIEFLKRNCKQPRLNASTLRSIFGSLGLVQPRIPTNHYHPESAGYRNASTDFISRYSANLGCDAYFMQKSAADERNGRHGSRAFFWHKDVSATASSFNPGTNDVLGIVDTDMYLDMPDLLAKHPRTYVISTFQPELVSYAGSEYSYTFNADGQCVYRISGGAVFNHWVWNYGTDVLMTSTNLVWFGYENYHIQRRP